MWQDCSAALEAVERRVRLAEAAWTLHLELIDVPGSADACSSARIALASSLRPQLPAYAPAPRIRVRNAMPPLPSVRARCNASIAAQIP